MFEIDVCTALGYTEKVCKIYSSPEGMSIIIATYVTMSIIIGLIVAITVNINNHHIENEGGNSIRETLNRIIPVVFLSGTFVMTTILFFNLPVSQEEADNNNRYAVYKHNNIIGKWLNKGPSVDEKIEFAHGLIMEKALDNSNSNISFETYTLDVSGMNIDSLGSYTSDVLRIFNTFDSYADVYIQIDKSKSEIEQEILSESVPARIACSDSLDTVTFEGYLVKEEIMKGLPRGFYNAVLHVPSNYRTCTGENNFFK